jgi:hypothetical protein
MSPADPPRGPLATTGATTMTTISDDEIGRLVEKMKRPDNSYSLLDLEAAVMKEFGLSAKIAKRLVRAWDRRSCISASQLSRLWEAAEAAERGGR